MILRIDALKEICSKILTAVDDSELSLVTETLQLKTVGNELRLAVTNKEYYAEVKMELTGDVEDFHATVNAKLFLKLISQITTETISFTLADNSLVIKGNGTYKLPLIFEGDALLELPKIKIGNPTVNMNIDSSVLLSILQYNSKEISKGSVVKPVQKLYYVDDKGAITFTTGACVNNFTLEKPVSILLNNRLVKLFKLFNNGNVNFTLGFDALSDDIIQTKVKFENKDISITAILSCDDTLLKSVPVSAIRGRAEYLYPYQVSLNKDALLQTINRLLLFTSLASSKELVRPFSTFEFKSNEVVIWDGKKENCESIAYVNGDLNIDGSYETILDLTDLKITLETCVESYLNLKFGNTQCIVLSRGNISNVIPEVKMGV